MALHEVRIIGVGHELPGDPITTKQAMEHGNVTNFDEEWVKEKLGIETRYSVRELPGKFNEPSLKEGFSNSDICTTAAKRALKKAGMTADQLDLIIVATCTPDFPVPAESTLVQDKLGIDEVATLDVRSACCGAFQAFATGLQFARTGYHKNILICAADCGTMFGDQDLDHDTRQKKAQSVNWLLIGDAAGAMIMRAFEPTEKPWGIEILHSHFKAIGKGVTPGFYMPAGGSSKPFSNSVLEKGEHFFAHNFRQVLEHGQELYWRSINEIVDGGKISLSDIDLYIPHQANGKLADFARKFESMLGVTINCYNNFAQVGNTANASTYLSLSEVEEKGLAKDGDMIALLGAESTKWLFGTIVLKYHPMDPNYVADASTQRVRVQPSTMSKMCSSMMVYGARSYFALRKMYNSYMAPAPTAKASHKAD